ncbi:conserved hypothetical protein [Burkholderia diffusa]|uniref:hypothetical protein n=1 Tax=unclassified Burkholderia TaxID=2613784 RepID=UPI0007584F64|nr:MULTISPECIES: hypothetical protein [Burkholderia]KUY54286.1 hypothetical protein WS45_20570 [Burkholderia sp. RF2-non_BP3]KUY75912.1 hypothetical protein WS46_02635 [Burkholderia sp. RF4-BP95]CAG9253948.1 conserved hypothetical protein [Burkholderia diffusa]
MSLGACESRRRMLAELAAHAEQYRAFAIALHAVLCGVAMAMRRERFACHASLRDKQFDARRLKLSGAMP